MRVLTCFDDRESVPWANGAGRTTELVSLTDSMALTPELRRWRLSIAALESTGPFSRLPGMVRTFLPTAEVALRIGSHLHRAGPSAPLRFHGDDDVSLVELARKCFAINLMVEDPGAGTDGESSGLGALQMHCPVPTEEAHDHGRQRFVLTLETTSSFRRFQLLELAESDKLPESLEVVVLN